MGRQFEDKEAKREMTPLRVMLTSPSTGGKTYSALRLAAGIQKVCPGPIELIDTENKRSLLYADDFSFRFIHFPAPHSASDFQNAIAHASARKPSVIIVDSMSDEHEGDGGLLDFQFEEVERLTREWNKPRGKVLQASWIEPKRARKQLIREIRKVNAHIIFCFRADQKTDWVKSKRPGASDGDESPVSQGWMPIAGREWIYEMTFALVFGPQADGKPIIDPEKLTAAQRLSFKINKPFDKFFKDGHQITEKIGEQIALWCTQGSPLEEGWSKSEEIKTGAESGPKIAETGPDHSEPCALCRNNPPRCTCAGCDKHKGKCEIELIWRGAENHQRWGPRPGRWGCPRKCPPQKTTIKGTDWHAILDGEKKLKTEREGALFQEEPGANG